MSSTGPVSPQDEYESGGGGGGTFGQQRTMNEGTMSRSPDSSGHIIDENGMSLSESDSDDNSVLSQARSSTAGSPPAHPTVRRKLNRKTLFRRRKKDAGGDPTSSTADGCIDSSYTSRKKGLFRRRHTRHDDHSSPGPRQQQQLLRPRSSKSLGKSLSDTESRPRKISEITAGSNPGMNSRGSSAGGIGSSQSGSFRPKSMAHGGGITARSYHGNIPRSNGAGGGGGGGGKEALFYPAQPLHRIRSTGAAEEGHGLSQDPNFSPPIRLPENGDAAERPSTRGEVRYGDYIRLWGYSTYAEKSGYVGSLRRTTRKRNSVGKGELFVLPPVPSNPTSIFHESCFKIVDPQAEKEDGDVLRFGEEISLVDDRGMVWNNKDGRLHGRLGPSLFGNGGHMQLKLFKRLEPSPDGNSRVSAATSSESGKGDGREGPAAILYGDSCEIVAKKIRAHHKGVVRAPVTHFRRRHQLQLGGYLRSDGKGFPCAFTIHHSPPRICMVSVYSFSADGTVADTHTHYKIPWNQELEFDLPAEEESSRGQGSGDAEAESPSDDEDVGVPVLRVILSNGGEMTLRARDVKACDGEPTWCDVEGLAEPSSILASSRRKIEEGDEETDEKSMSREVLTLGGVLVAFSVVKALAARAPRLFLSKELPMALEVALDVVISVMMIIVVLRQKGVPAALVQIPDRPNSVKYVLKLIKCEVGAADGKPADGVSDASEEGLPPMPDTFLLAECGDHDKAYARWKATVQWRQDSGANEALKIPHPRFDLIKKHYPTYFHGKDKTGAVIYYEQLGKVDDEALKRVGLDSKQMLWHYMYQMEYLWTVINPNDEDRVTTVLDLKGVTLATSTKAEIIGFIKQAVTMMSTHYPERSRHVLLISWPRWFDWIFRFVRPLLSESTKSKMSSCTAANVYETLLEKIDNDQIPKEYGGASEYALGEHPWEVAMRDNALKVLEEHGKEMEAVVE